MLKKISFVLLILIGIGITGILADMFSSGVFTSGSFESSPTDRIVYEDPSDIYDSSIVSINKFCTGFVIDEGLVMTAAHCAQTPGTTIMIFFDWMTKSKLGVWVYTSKKYDIALLKVDTEDRTPFSISSTDPVEGDSYILKGYPGGIPFIVNVELYYSGPVNNWGIYTGTAIRGYSGSPVVNRDHSVFGLISMGEMVGIPARGIQVITNTFWMTYTEKATALQETLSEYLEEQDDQ